MILVTYRTADGESLLEFDNDRLDELLARADARFCAPWDRKTERKWRMVLADDARRRKEAAKNARQGATAVPRIAS